MAVTTFLLQELKHNTDKNGNGYYSGTVLTLERQRISIKIWGRSLAYNQVKSGIIKAGDVVSAEYSINEYQGTLSWVLDLLKKDTVTDVAKFLPQKYDIEVLYDHLTGYAQKYMSEKGYSLLQTLLFDNEELNKRFKEEFAASSHHDNCVGGLLAHTYKMLKFMLITIEEYEDIFKAMPVAKVQDFKDLLIMGTILHDVGKTMEMHFGGYTVESYVSHRVFGMEYLFGYKDTIISTYDEHFYYQLLAVISQHHNEWAERSRTIASFLVHEVDEYDARVTLLAQNTYDGYKGGSTNIYVDDNRLDLY